MPNKNNKPAKSPGLLAGLKKIVGLNIGTIIFAVLFLYMLFSAFLYLTSNKVESYQVISGPLSRNETYTGLAIREESVCKADTNGYITYFAREGNKINANGAVYGISSTKTPEVTAQISQENLSEIRNIMLSFSKGFDPSNFNNTYSFKYELEGNILQYASEAQNMVSESDETELDDSTSDTDSSVSTSSVITLGNQTISKASSDGIVLYSKDGYEEKTIDTLTLDDFDQNSYHETDLKTQEKVNVGDEIYTIITDEKWNLLIPLSEKQATKLSDKTSIRVKFLKDDMTQTGSFSIIEIEGAKYGKLEFNNGLIRYASERFLDIELVTNTVSGLKIPLSSIVTKEFYTIPSDYATTNEDSNETGFMVEETNKDGETVNTFINATIYATETIQNSSGSTSDEDEKYLYYVDKSEFQEGDAIVSQKGQGRYIVGDVGVLEGVYCINKGYAVFRKIEILDQNEEYAIVSKDTSYGLSRYDHIVRNADSVDEEDILY